MAGNWRERTKDGLLLTFRPSATEAMRPTSFELVANLKAAKELGVEIPPALLARTDAVVE